MSFVISGFLNSIRRNCGYLSLPVGMSYNSSPDIDTPHNFLELILATFNAEETTKNTQLRTVLLHFHHLQL